MAHLKKKKKSSFMNSLHIQKTSFNNFLALVICLAENILSIGF